MRRAAMRLPPLTMLRYALFDAAAVTPRCAATLCAVDAAAVAAVAADVDADATYCAAVPRR